MKNLKDKIYNIILLLLCIVFCKNCTSDYLKGGDSKAISNYEKMISENTTALAELYPEYKEITVKILKMPIKTYEFKYHFSLNGVAYDGNHTFQSKLPESNQIKVYYLKEDPSFNNVDPQSLLREEKEKNSSKSNLYWAIGWGVLGLLTLLSLLVGFKKKKVE